MTGTERVFFANRMTLKIKKGSGTQATLAVLHGCEIIPQAEHIEEYGMDSIFRADVAKVKFKVDFKVKYAKFNPLVGEWWQMGIWKVLTTGTDGKVCDSNDVALFEAEGTITDGAATPQKLQATVKDIYFPSMPLVIAENQYIVHDLSGVGKTVEFTNPTT